MTNNLQKRNSQFRAIQNSDASRQSFITGVCTQTDGLTTEEVVKRTGLTEKKVHQQRHDKGFIQTDQAVYIRLKQNTWTEYQTLVHPTAA